MDDSRVDRWLWTVRLYPTRTAATEACRKGHVKVNGTSAKPSTAVRPGDRIVARAHGRERVVDVVALPPSRVGAPIAVTCYADHSPPPPEDPFRRDRSTGRPTKKERRQLDRFRRG